jgi:hypothetical protein
LSDAVRRSRAGKDATSVKIEEWISLTLINSRDRDLGRRKRRDDSFGSQNYQSDNRSHSPDALSGPSGSTVTGSV